MTAVVLTVAASAAGARVGRHWWLDRTGGAPVQVVLTEWEGTTGDAVLDRSLTQAMRMDLAQSPWVTVVPASTADARIQEMRRKPEDLVIPAVSREVCERTGSQAVLSGSLAKVGQHYLIMGWANSCVDGSVVGQAKDEASSAEGLPHAIDRLAAGLRQKLGESRRSIARFNTPLFAQNTPSLEALKALSQGIELNRKGDALGAISLFKVALAADPNFAWAYYDLATSYSNAGDYAASRDAIGRAYLLRDTAGKLQAFAINALYNALATQDLYVSLRNYQDWVRLYPNSALAWNGMAYVQANLGRYTDEIASDRRVLALAPNNQNNLNELATGLLQSGDAQGAKKTLDQAIAMNFDGNYIRVRYLELAYLLHDESLLRAQRVWSDAHPTTPILLVAEAQIAIAEGRFGDARKLVTRASGLFREQGAEGAADQFLKTEAVAMMEAGDAVDGKQMFLASPPNLEEGDQVLGLACAGEIVAAQSAIRSAQARFPSGTLWKFYWIPLTQAVIALQQDRAKDAAAALEIARPVERRELVVPWIRATAYLTSGQPALADFRSVVSHPEIDPSSSHIPLSWLGLGRALAAQGKLADSIEAYRHFLALWSNADPDAVYLREAKLELANLEKSTTSQ